MGINEKKNLADYLLYYLSKPVSLPLAWRLFVRPLMLIDLKIVHILAVDIDFQQIIVHFLVEVVEYVLQDYLPVVNQHLLHTRYRYRQMKCLVCFYLPSPQDDQCVCVIRHFHFWDVTHVHQTHESSSKTSQNNEVNQIQIVFFYFI